MKDKKRFTDETKYIFLHLKGILVDLLSLIEIKKNQSSTYIFFKS